MGEFRRATVAELQAEGVLLVEDGNHGEYRPRPDEFVDSGVAFIRAADMDAGRVLFASASRINDRARKRITKGIGAPGDVLLSHKGTVGKVAIVEADAPSFVCSPQTTFWRTLRTYVLDRRYLYAYLRSPEFHRQLASRAGETDMAPYVSLTAQRQLIVVLPPIGEQRRIAGILGALDDKIELNRRLGETLQTTARVLFNSWFMAGLRTEADGWRHSVIGKDFEVTMGQSPPGSTYNSTGDGLPFYQGRADFGTRFPARRVYCTAPTRTAAAGDTLLSVRAPVGDINIATETCAIGRGVAAIRHHSGSRTYTFEFMGSIRRVLDEYNGHGTVFGAIGGKDLSAIPCLAPPDGLVRRFDEQARPLDERLENLERQRQTLTEVRDAMLPRLMAGEMSPSIGRGQGA